MNEFEEEDFQDDPESFTPQIAKIANPLKFFLAGKAFFTLRSKKTQDRYTYRVVQATDKVDKTKKLQFWFCSFLTGPDNWQNYTYIGSIRPNGKGGFEFVTTRASKLPANSPPCVAINYTMDCLSSMPMAPGVEIWHAGRCCVCGRMLTVPESIANGIGPECASKS
jgi:hypothetical protein